jgi:hypothetical protein
MLPEYSRLLRGATCVAILAPYLLMAATRVAEAGQIVSSSAPLPLNSPLPTSGLDGGIDNTESSSPLRFRPILTFNTPAPQLVTFGVHDYAHTLEYDVTLRTNNNTIYDWHGLKLELGFLTSNGFVISTLPGLDFDTPDQDAIFSYGMEGEEPVIHTDTLLMWANLFEPVYAGFDELADLAIDVPNLDPAYVPIEAIIYDGDTAIGYYAVLRVTPLVIPEPGSLVALLAAGLGLSLRRRMRS